jgi:SAM-dependent methyltransferase
MPPECTPVGNTPMRKQWSESLKKLIRPILFRMFPSSSPAYHCPLCGYRGSFKDKHVRKSPQLVRVSSKCPQCTSTERHRMMHLVLVELFQDWNPSDKSVLHIAPEDCLAKDLKNRFATYHSADLFKKGVDFQEDIQKMSFPDAAYDCVLVSRVLTVPPDLEASLGEIRRILKPRGIAILAEAYPHKKTDEFGEWRNERSREVGIDLLENLESRFERVDRYLSNRYEEENQIHNLMVEDGNPKDSYPEAVRLKGRGFMDLVVVCHA